MIPPHQLVTVLTTFLLVLGLPPARADGIAGDAGAGTNYTWLRRFPTTHLNSIFHRIPPPAGAVRVDLPDDGFGAWLRHLPLKTKGTPVVFYDGRLKPNQSVHEAVVDIDIGNRDLQQCADSIIRLRAEYLYARQAIDRISFHYTSGHLIPFSKWSKGFRPILSGPPKTRRWEVKWEQKSPPDRSRNSFERYLRNIFTYAGTMSLSRNLPRRYPNSPKVGDLYLKGGFPGHTVLIVDKAFHPHIGDLVLLAQGFMPAQSLHILKNNTDASLSPWFKVPRSGTLPTPEFTFDTRDLFFFSPEE